MKHKRHQKTQGYPREDLSLSRGVKEVLFDSEVTVTNAGSSLYAAEWDFRQDHENGGVIPWNADVISSGVKIGELLDPHFASLVRPFQEAICVRWKYARSEDGRSWNARRAQQAVFQSRTFAVWAAAQGVTSVSEISEDLLLAWIAESREKSHGAGEKTLRERRYLLAAPLLLWRVRDRLNIKLGFEPFSTDPSAWIREGKDNGKIDLIPKPLLAHVVGAAIRYIDLYSKDILQARAYVNALVDQWEKDYGRTAPQWKRGCPEYARLDTWLGRRFGTRRRCAARFMGCPAPWNADGKFLKDPDTQLPWLDGITGRGHLQQLENSLRTACYVILAFMTGARSIEMALLKEDCLESVEQMNGNPRRYSVRGAVTKFRGRQSEDVAWGVLEIAAKAVEMLKETLASWRSKKQSNRLFVTQTGARINKYLINVDLKVFLERIGAPYVNGKPFPLSSQMFRVALAQWIGQEPYGEIAGAIHLKQLSTAAFRGYLREDPTFRSLIETMEVQASADHLEMVLAEPVLLGHKGKDISRHRTPEHQARLEAQVRSLDYAQVGSEAPLERTVARIKESGRPVYKTKLTMCLFSPDTAECLKDKPIGERQRPLTHRCNPATCANSAITRLQVPAYLEDYEAAAAMASDPAESPSQVKIHREQMQVLAGIILPFVSVLAGELKSLQTEIEGGDSRDVVTVAKSQRRDEIYSMIARINAARMEEVVGAQ